MVRQNVLGHLSKNDSEVTPLNPHGVNPALSFKTSFPYGASHQNVKVMCNNILAYEKAAEKVLGGESLLEQAYYKLLGEVDLPFTGKKGTVTEVYEPRGKVRTDTAMEKAEKYPWKDQLGMLLTDEDCRKILASPIGDIEKNDPELYTKGKEKTRFKDYGNLAFGQAMDALAVIKQNRNNNSLETRISEKVNEINRKRGVTAGPKFIDLANCGAEKAGNRRTEYNAAHPRDAEKRHPEPNIHA